jgi:hypothetical protein
MGCDLFSRVYKARGDTAWFPQVRNRDEQGKEEVEGMGNGGIFVVVHLMLTCDSQLAKASE